MTEFVVKT